MRPILFVIALLLLAAAASFGQQPGNAPYLDPSLSLERRAADIVSRMTLEEKVLQMQNSAPAVSVRSSEDCLYPRQFCGGALS